MVARCAEGVVTNLQDPFRCPRGCASTVDDCESLYTDANALRCEQSPCYLCRRGRRLRQKLANEAPQDIVAIFTAWCRG